MPLLRRGIPIQAFLERDHGKAFGRPPDADGGGHGWFQMVESPGRWISNHGWTGMDEATTAKAGETRSPRILSAPVRNPRFLLPIFPHAGALVPRDRAGGSGGPRHAGERDREIFMIRVCRALPFPASVS